MNTALISKNGWSLCRTTLSSVTHHLSPADTWRRSRKLIHSAVSMAANTKYQSLMTDEATLTLHDLATDPSNFSRHFQRYSYGVLARSLLGFRITSTDDNFVIQKEYILDEAMKCFLPDHYPSNIFPFLRVLPGWLVPSVAKLEMLREKVDTEVKRLRKMVEDGIKDGTSLDCIYRHFIEHRDEWAAISDEEAEYAIDSVIGAATRSPFNALLTTCYLMMEYPEWMEKMQKQVDEVVGREGGRIPTFADIPNLPVVRAVVKESIRYRSIKAELGIPHQLAEHDVYEGYFFAKGTVFHANYPCVLLLSPHYLTVSNTWHRVILMDKEMYPDQQVFNPARWLEPSYPTYQEPLTEFPNCKNFVPFGYGRRACPGLDFAERALVIMVAQLACAFDIRKPQDPISGEPVHIEIEYEKGPNPKPLPFPCDISLRSGNNPLKSRDLPPALSTR